MKIHFTISEFLIDRSTHVVPVHVVDKIVKHHIPILNPIREKMGAPVFISQHSGYRPYAWEVARGRDGSSEHTFGDSYLINSSHLGAVDLRAEDMIDLLKLLLESDYKRVCYYPKKGFIHCDFKGDDFQYFINGEDGWEFQGRRK